MLRRNLCLCAGLLVLAAAPVFAQTTGSIQGKVVDHQNQAITGATVVLTGDPIPGAQRIAVSDTNGGFRFQSLPVGRYAMTATLSGFQERSVENFRVSIDAVASVTFTMHPEAFAGEIEVTGETPLVDVVSSSTTASYDEEFVEALPTRNNFYDILSVAPAVSQPDDTSLPLFSGYGTNMTSQTWNVDGLSLGAPGGGWLAFELNPDIVAETSFTQGADARYGSTLGNVWNLVTKSGTNSFHGSIGAVFQDNSLVDPNVEIPESEWPDYRLHDPGGVYVIDDYYDFRGTLGGPIVRDRLWFFAGAQILKRNATDPDNVPGIPGSGQDTTRFDLKVSAQLAANHRLVFRAFAQDWDLAVAPDMYTALSRTYYEPTDTDMFVVDYNAILSDNTLLDVNVGTWEHRRQLESRTGSTEHAFNDDTHGGPALLYGAPWWFFKRHEEATQADVVLSYFADEFIKGSHEFKFGVQYYEGSDKRTAARTGFSWNQPAFYYPYYNFTWAVYPPFIYGAEIETHSAFFDDTWRISDRLTIDVGVRWDRQQGRIPDYPRLDAESNETDEIIPGKDMIDWSNFAPRIGFAWQPTGSGKTVIRGFAGRFWDGPTASAWFGQPPGRADAVTYFFGTPIASVPVAPDIDPNVKNPYSDEYSLAFDHQIGQDFAIGAQLVYKETRDMIGWEIADDGIVAPFLWDDPYTEEVEQIELIDVFVSPSLRKSNGPGPGSLLPDAKYNFDYQGAILTFRKRYSKGWDLMASYTWSNTEGLNTVPFSNGSIGQGLPLFGNADGSNPNHWHNADHLMMGDREHMFRIQSNVDVGWGLRLSGILNIQSGRPYLRLAQLTGAYTGAPINVIADAGEHLRTPSSTMLDLGLQKTFGLGRGVNLDIALQVLNALNDDAVEYWATWILYPGDDFVPANWVSPRRAQIRLKLGF